jgi:hypothetical protein
MARTPGFQSGYRSSILLCATKVTNQKNKMTRQKNLCGKTRPLDNPYEIWRTLDQSWEWKVLKKWQIDDNKEGARWFCGVKSPYTYGSYELGDVFVHEIIAVARKVR